MLMLHVVIRQPKRTMHAIVCGAVAFVLVVSAMPAALGTYGLAHATGQTCQVTSLVPHNPSSGTETGFEFTITSDDQVSWARVISPSSSLVINGGSSDWLPSVSYTSSQATFTGSPIDPGNPISIHVDAAVSYFPSSYWVVQTAIDSGGSDRVNCTGDTSITVSDNGPPVINSITATASKTTANISWTTDKTSDSLVDYGLTTSYGQQKYSATMTTSHSINLSGLTPNTTYHYRVTSEDNASQSVSSNDGTFHTAANTSTGGGGGSSGGSGGSSGGSGTPIGGGGSNSSDKTPPTIAFTSQLPAVTATTPTVQGVAGDDVAVKKVEYSIDNGKNWLGVDHASGLGSTHVTFDFTPLNLEDNTYLFKARAVDSGGNITATKAVQVVIDRLPPTVGGSVISVGPQILEPDSNGVITTLSGINLQLALSTTGGASTVNVNALDVDHNNTVAASFSLMRAEDTGLWSGTLSFSEPGHFQLVAHAVDGAHNSDTRVVAAMSVTRPALVVSSKGPVNKAVATVYYLDPDTNSWIIWDGQAYGQTNPQTSDAHGSFAVMLPIGTYYVHIDAKGYLPLNSTSFTLQQPQPLASVFHLQASDLMHIALRPIAGFIAQDLTSNLGASSVPPSFAKQMLTGKQFPGFTLQDTAGKRQNSVAWLGKPTLVTVMSTWTPTAAEQISALDLLASNHDINVKLIGLQENTARLGAYSAIAGTAVPWLADPDGALGSKLHIGTMPVHFLINRNGTVTRIVSGTLSTSELLHDLTGTP